MVVDHKCTELIKKLRECNYVEWHKSDGSIDCITDLFWVYPMSIDLLKVFTNVLIIECTYKTNRYMYPLFEIVGVTSTELTFPVGFAFMNHEYKDNYTWAMERLKNLMGPNTFLGLVVIDRELALTNAIHKIFSTTTTLLLGDIYQKMCLLSVRNFFYRK